MAKLFRIVLTILVMGGTIFSATGVASAASWTHLGGDPLFEGGIQGSGQQARNEFVGKMESPRGQLAMERAGLSRKQRHAVNEAFTRGNFTQCTLNVGDHFEAMSFGVGTVLVDKNVTFEDTSNNGAPAFCFKVTVDGTTIEGKIPFKCLNFSITKKRSPHKPHTAEVKVCKIAVVEGSGVNIDPVPTGIFHMTFTAKGYPSKTVTINNRCETVGRYRVGTKVHGEELKPTGNDEWQLVNPDQNQKVGSHGNTFVFKNIEKTKPPQLQTPSQPQAPEQPKGSECSNSISGSSNTSNTQKNACFCNNINSNSSNNTSHVECECVGINVTCERKTPPPTCEAGEIGTPPHCEKPKCPEGTVGTPPNCEKPAPKEPLIVITSITALNQIEEGRSSPVHIKVTANESGGSLTIDPGIGAVSSCESTTKEESFTFKELPAGESNLCVTIYAPSDSDKPTSMEMSATAVLGNSVSFAFQIFEITYPTRPS